MKRLLVILMALILMAALSLPALAADVRRTNKSVKVYEDTSTHSEVLEKIGKGKKVLIEEDYGSWVGILVESPEGGQMMGYIQSKYLECDHNWTDWVVKRKASCTKAGLRIRECTICGKEQTKEIEKLGHDYGKWTVIRTATCARDGLRVRTCKRCGYEEEKTFREDHTYAAWVITKQPTCTAVGTRQRTCQVCGHVDTQEIEKVPHDLEYRIIVEATDHSSGTRAAVCKNCGYTEKATSYDPEGTMRRYDRGENVYQLQQLLVDQGYLNAGGADGIFGGGTEKALIKFQTEQGLTPDGIAWPQTQRRLSHDFGPWETVRAMTRTEPGQRRRVCKDCNYEQVETIEAGDVIERGARGEHVRALQQILKQLGYNAGGFDGIYGKRLDSAFTDFDADHGLTFEQGTVRPADLDALLNAWFATGIGTLSEGGAESPVNMALTINPASDDLTDTDVTTYTWSLTNLGSKKCMFTAILLTYGDNPDFTHDNMVMVIDGEELKANVGNSLTGSFKVANSWGAGNLNFAAMAVDEETGRKWLSNTVTFETEIRSAEKTVEPLPVDINVAALQNGTYPAAFDRGDIAKVNSGIYMNAVHIFSMDTYDASAIEALAAGDTVIVEGQNITVNTVELRDGDVLVNGGPDEGCVFTIAEGGDTYRLDGDDDRATYTERGMTTLPVDTLARFVDSSDITREPVTTEYDGLYDAIMNADIESFDQFNTTLTVKDGKVVEIHRVFTP